MEILPSADAHRRLGSTSVGFRPKSRHPRLLLLRDGDLTPYSMTIAFLASCEDHCIPRPEMVLLLMSVVLEPLMGKFGP